MITRRSFLRAAALAGAAAATGAAARSPPPPPVQPGLPPGMRLSPAGVLGGVPQQAGTWQFTLTVTDERGLSSSRQMAITIGRKRGG